MSTPNTSIVERAARLAYTALLRKGAPLMPDDLDDARGFAAEAVARLTESGNGYDPTELATSAAEVAVRHYVIAELGGSSGMQSSDFRASAQDWLEDAARVYHRDLEEAEAEGDEDA